MTNLPPTTLDFQGHPVRVIEEAPKRGRFVPVNDLADATGRDRKSVRNLVDRDPVLAEMGSRVVTTLEVGTRETLCLPYNGALLLLAKMNASRSATTEAREILMAFQRWAASVLESAMLGEPSPTLPVPALRPRLSGAFIARTREQVGHTGTTAVLERIWPEWFANLPGVKPCYPPQVITPTLGLEETTFRLKLEKI
jgi:hypothetical protein